MVHDPPQNTLSKNRRDTTCEQRIPRKMESFQEEKKPAEVKLRQIGELSALADFTLHNHQTPTAEIQTAAVTSPGRQSRQCIGTRLMCHASVTLFENKKMMRFMRIDKKNLFSAQVVTVLLVSTPPPHALLGRNGHHSNRLHPRTRHQPNASQQHSSHYARVASSEGVEGYNWCKYERARICLGGRISPPPPPPPTQPPPPPAHSQPYDGRSTRWRHHRWWQHRQCSHHRKIIVR